jgi:hypothetical protein
MTDRSCCIPIRLNRWTDEMDTKRVRFSLHTPDVSGQGMLSVQALNDGWWSVAIVSQTPSALATYHLSQAEADSIRRVEGSFFEFSVNPGMR